MLPGRIRLNAAATLPGLFIALAMVMLFVTESIRSLGFHGTPIPQVVWLRYGFHLLLMIVVFGRPARMSFLKTGRPGLHIFRSLLMLAMPMSYVLAVQTARSSAVLAVFAVSPLVVIGLARAAGEPVPRFAWTTVAIGVVGSFILYRPAVLAMGWGALAAVAMAFSYSGYIVLTRLLDRTEPMLTNLFYSAVGVFVALTLAAPFYWRPVGLRELVAGGAVAVSGWIVLYLLELALRRDTASRIAPFLLVQTLLDGLARVIDRGPAAPIVLGTGLIAAAIVAAIVLAARQPLRQGCAPAVSSP